MGWILERKKKSVFLLIAYSGLFFCFMFMTKMTLFTRRHATCIKSWKVHKKDVGYKSLSISCLKKKTVRPWHECSWNYFWWNFSSLCVIERRVTWWQGLGGVEQFFRRHQWQRTRRKWTRRLRRQGQFKVTIAFWNFAAICILLKCLLMSKNVILGCFRHVSLLIYEYYKSCCFFSNLP